MPRTEFTQEQRAELFVLDRATCTYSGRSLWIADYGIDPLYQIDWADHIVPASQGGPSDLKNGAAAGGAIDPPVLRQLQRGRRLHVSDWYLNRAMWHVTLAMYWRAERAQGLKRSRDDEYYAKAATRHLEKWRSIATRHAVKSLECRDLTPSSPGPDQVRLLELRNAESIKAVLRVVGDLYPAFAASLKATEQLSLATSAAKVHRVGCIDEIGSYLTNDH
jgi:hypothetical protein